MNHQQTAQNAMAQAAAGQVPEVQPAQETVQIGFEKALTMMNPNWRATVAPEVVNQYRHFYNQGVQHIGFLIQMSNQNMQQNLDAVMHTVIVTGNEEQIARMQQEALATQGAEVTPDAEVKPKATKATKAVATRATKKPAPKKGASGRK